MSFSQESLAAAASPMSQMASSASKWTPTLKGTAKEQRVEWPVVGEMEKKEPQILWAVAVESRPLVPVAVWRAVMSR